MTDKDKLVDNVFTKPLLPPVIPPCARVIEVFHVDAVRGEAFIGWMMGKDFHYVQVPFTGVVR